MQLDGLSIFEIKLVTKIISSLLGRNVDGIIGILRSVPIARKPSSIPTTNVASDDSAAATYPKCGIRRIFNIKFRHAWSTVIFANTCGLLIPLKTEENRIPKLPKTKDKDRI